MTTDLNKIFIKIKELGHVNSKKNELRDYCKLKFDQIIKFLSRRLISDDGADLLDCLLNGLSDQAKACRNKIKIIDIVFQTMRQECSSLAHCSDVMSRICLELSQQPIEDVVRWGNDSIQSIIEDSDVNMTWRDVLPECLNTILSHPCITHCGTEMSGIAFQEQCIKTLFQCCWTDKQLVQLTAMFRDMQLSKNDHKQVVNKICSHLINVEPTTLPPLVLQLLKLCKTYHIEIVLAHLAHYFNIRIYAKLEPPPSDSESTTMEIEDFAQYSTSELTKCLSTCIYHVTQGATEPELIKKHLKLWSKNQLLRSPFLLDLALAISDKGRDFRTACLDVIKFAIEQNILDQQKSKESAWVKSISPPSVDVSSVLKVLIAESEFHNHLTTMGLINLGFVLLSTSRLKSVASMCWTYGQLILVRLSKSQPDTTRHILSQLTDRLSGDSTALRQYSECLYILCKLTPVSVERCPQVSTILENCQPTNKYNSAVAVLDAVHPLLRFSTKIRDTLVVVCRKRLYSRDSLHRCLALSGFLSVLRHVKLPRVTSLSNSQEQFSDNMSNYSYLTQITVDVHATQQGTSVNSRVRNEAMCMEVVSILRRCLIQDAPVKQLLYSSIYESSKEKIALYESILELLYEHLSKYLSEDDQSIIVFEKCVQVNATTAVLFEPIGQLLYTIAQFLQNVDEEDLEDILSSQNPDTASAHLKSKLETTLTLLTDSEQLTSCNSDDGPGLTDLTPESRAKCLKLQQKLQCLEALIGHQILQWSAASTNSATTVNRLYKCYNELLGHTKVSPKSSKKDKMALNDTKETQKSQRSQKSQKVKKSAAVKLNNIVKDRVGPFKPLPCVWDVGICVRVVQLLYSEEVTWSSAEQRNNIRSRREFHHFTLKNIQSVLTNANIEKRHVFAYVPKIANVLYKRCIVRFQDICDFCEQTALACIELFRECLSLILSPNLNFKTGRLFSNITETTEDELSESVAEILEQVNKALRSLDLEIEPETERDVHTKKIVVALGQLVATVLEIPNLECHPALMEATNKLEQYARMTQRDCVALIPPLLAACCRQHQEGVLLHDLITKLTAVMGVIYEENNSRVSDSDSFVSVDDKTSQTVLGYVCAHLITRFRHAEHLLSRAKDLQMALKCCAQFYVQKIDKELKELFKCLVVQLSQMSSWCGKLARLHFPVGTSSDKVLQTCTRLYAVLAAFMKQLIVYVDHDATLLHPIRLERLLKLSGRKLSTVIDNAITHVEASQGRRGGSAAGGGAGVLKDTRHIPRLVLEVERFSEYCLLLSNNTKVDLQQYLSLGTARDFRIKAPVLQEALAQDLDQTRPDVDMVDDEGETVTTSPVASDAEDSSSAEECQPKRRKSK